jgi:hypothetical protein
MIHEMFVISKYRPIIRILLAEKQGKRDWPTRIESGLFRIACFIHFTASLSFFALNLKIVKTEGKP